MVIGKQMRDYQYVLDHCSGISMVLQHGTIGEVYNIGTGKEMTNLQMVEILLDELKLPQSLIQHVEDRQGHDRRYCMNVDKLIALGWEPEYTHEEAIRKTVRWYVDNRWWWEPIRSGEFKEYYQRLYGERKVLKQGKSTQVRGRVALVHDWLNQLGGAENVLEELVGMLPGALIYTSIYAPERMPSRYRSWDIHTSFMQQLPGVTSHHQKYLAFYPLANEWT